jgi:hypothetical protein
MKHLLLAFTSLLLLASCEDKVTTQDAVIDMPLFNWHMKIPDGFEKETQAEWDEIKAKGTEVIEESMDEKIEGEVETIMVFKKDDSNYFDANYQDYDSLDSGGYLQSCKNVNEVIYETFLAQMVDLQIDSSSTTVMIDGLEFQQFNIVVQFPSDVKLTTHMYSRLFNDTELAINIMYQDAEYGQQMVDAWMTSSFH